tara:strand:- start:511 stop:780 length:270 start_codon:yes stop_codon:yes gene_type:complete
MMPAPACVTNDERIAFIEITVRDTNAQVRDLTIALTGNALGQKGIIPRLTSVEDKLETHDRKLLVWGAGLTVMASFLSVVKDKVIRIFS